VLELGLVHDELEEIEQVEEVVLAHPYKRASLPMRRSRRNRLDAHALGTLLRGNLVARAHVAAPRDASAQKSAAQRLYWARLRTMLRNRIHARWIDAHGQRFEHAGNSKPPCRSTAHDTVAQHGAKSRPIERWPQQIFAHSRLAARHMGARPRLPAAASLKHAHRAGPS